MFVAETWRNCRDGMEETRWIEMLGIASLVLGGPLEAGPPDRNGKGKAKEPAPSRSEEVASAAIGLLQVLLRPLTPRGPETDDEIIELDETLPDDPTRPCPPSFPTKAVPLLFHALTALLSASTSTNATPSDRAAALTTIRDLLLCLNSHQDAAGPLASTSTKRGRDFVASALPGCVSTVCKVALAVSSKSDEICAALDLLEVVVTTSAGEGYQEVQDLLRETSEETEHADEGGRKLQEMVDQWRRQQEPGEAEAPAPTNGSLVPLADGPSSSKAAPSLLVRSVPWLHRTVHHLSLSFRLLTPLSSHHSPNVREAWARVCASFLKDCSAVLSLKVPLTGDEEGEARPAEGLQIVVQSLLLSSTDDWPSVARIGRTALADAAGSSKDNRRRRSRIVSTALELLASRLKSLPRSIHRHDDAQVLRSCRLLCAALNTLSGSDGTSGSTTTSIGHPNIERWSAPLLVALELQLPRLGTSQSADSEAAARRAWTGVESAASVFLISNGDPPATAASTASDHVFPPLRFLHITDPAVVKAVEAMLADLGAGALVLGLSSRLTLAEHFFGMALGLGVSTKGLGSLMMAELALQGLAARERTTQDSLGRRHTDTKRLAKFTKRTVRQLVESQDDDGSSEPGVIAEEHDDVSDGKTEAPTDVVALEANDSLPVSHLRGNTALASTAFNALKPTSSTPLEDKRRTHEAQKVQRTILVLRTLSTAASILEDAFRPLLFDVLYHILAQVASPFSVLREHAAIALTNIAFHTGYASPINLLLDNVDYVVNTVSQRLKYPRLDLDAPRVLVAMINLAGPEIIPFVEDVVEECFDALDDFHGYDALCASLLAVFDALLQAAGKNLDLVPKKEVSRFRKRKPDPVADYAKFEHWLQHRHDPPDDGVVESEPVPERPLDETSFKTEGDPAPMQEDEDEANKPPPPTRIQVVCLQMLSKALYFLSHNSPFLRARVLALVAAGVPVLGARSSQGSRESDLLPLVHRAWPFVLNRLTDAEPFVAAEAAHLEEVLARHAGDLMGQKIKDDVWPKFKALVNKQGHLESKASLHRSAYTVSHRLSRAIIKTMTSVAQDVDLKESFAWDVIDTMRRFLSSREHEELQRLAREMYVALAEENGDSVWLGVMAIAGRMDDMRFMAVPGAEANADLVLAVV